MKGVDLVTTQLDVPLAEPRERDDEPPPCRAERLVPCEIACTFGREPPPDLTDQPSVVRVDAADIGVVWPPGSSAHAVNMQIDTTACAATDRLSSR